MPDSHDITSSMNEAQTERDTQYAENLAPLDQSGVIEDNNEDARSAPPAPVAEDKPVEEVAPEEPQTKADARAELWDSMAGRLKETREGGLEANADAFRTEEQREAIKAENDKPAEEPEQKVRIKVRGGEEEIPLSELIADSQKFRAAESYLDETKQGLKDLKEERRKFEEDRARNHQEWINQQNPRHMDDQPEPEPEVNRIDELYIQAQEAQAAGDEPLAHDLIKERDSIRDSKNRESILLEIQQNNEAAQRDQTVRGEAETALIDIDAAFPGMVEDPVRKNTVEFMIERQASHTIAEYISGQSMELQVQFQQSGITQDYLTSGRLGRGEAMKLYHNLKSMGHGLPEMGAVIRAGGQNAAAHLGYTNPNNPNTQQPQNSQATVTDTQAPERSTANVDVNVNRDNRRQAIENQPRRASPGRASKTQVRQKPTSQERAKRGFAELQAARRGKRQG